MEALVPYNQSGEHGHPIAQGAREVRENLDFLDFYLWMVPAKARDQTIGRDALGAEQRFVIGNFHWNKSGVTR